MTVRPPTLGELVQIIGAELDDQRRARLVDWYWAKAADEHGLDRWGSSRAARYRHDYDWLVADRRRQVDQRLAEMRFRPALGAYRRHRRNLGEAA